MSSPPPRRAAATPFDRPPRQRSDAAASPRVPAWVRRELIVYGVALLFGLIGVPLLIWMGGNRVLGPYSHEQNPHAGPLALLQDYFVGLLHGSAVFWVVALGPAALVLLVRLLVALVRWMPASRRQQAPPSPSAPGRRGR